MHHFENSNFDAHTLLLENKGTALGVACPHCHNADLT